ncbi:CAF17-like 4Fe-4S cluster assembly/insertion protein YgfZ [Lysobacter xanthus]
MSDNPQYGTACVSLTGIRVLALTGGDAVVFAQSQFMNDVAGLGDGGWQWNGWLDPKGRVHALFALLRRDAGTLWLVTSAGAEDFAAALRRFVFRSRVKIEVLDLAVAGRFGAPTEARGSLAALRDGFAEFDWSGDAGARTLIVGGEPAARDAAAEAAWHVPGLAAGWPALPGVRLDAWTPHQLSLQRLGAFSVKKGCYPGQEIVARTHFLGRAKRGLARFRGIGEVDGQPMLQDADGRDVGQVVVGRGDELLAVVPLDPPDAPLYLAGTALERRALGDGLAR